MLKVLLVDDEPSVIQLLQNLIDWESLGYSICGAASNGEEALEILKQNNPHLAIVDIRMPGMNGLQLIQQATGFMHLRTKFIILSAHDDFGYAKIAMRHRVNEYVLKPVDDDEIVPILKKMHGQIQEEIHSEQYRQQQLKLIANHCLNRIIKGEIRESLIRRVRFLLNIKEKTYLRHVLVEIDRFDIWMNDLENVDIQAKRVSIRETIERSLGSDYLLPILEENIGRYSIILTSDMPLWNDLKQFSELSRKISEEYQCRVWIALSEKTEGIENLCTLYRQSLTALQYKFFQDKENVLLYESVRNIDMNYDIAGEGVKGLMEDIGESNLPGIRSRVNELFSEFRKKRLAPECIYAYVKNLQAEIIKQVLEHNGNVGDLAAELIRLNTLAGKTSMDKVKEGLIHLCLTTAAYNQKISGGDIKSVIPAIKEYIKQNYSMDLTLQKISKLFYINPVYLGQLFMKNAGMQFKEYLHTVRVEEAKKLLRRTDMKISEIASCVGYHDPEYFASKFKAITHSIPSAYKKGLDEEAYLLSEKSFPLYLGSDFKAKL